MTKDVNVVVREKKNLASKEEKKAKRKEDKKVKKLQKKLKTAKKIQQLLAENPEMLQFAMNGKEKSEEKR